jgi:hypothetical protein
MNFKWKTDMGVTYRVILRETLQRVLRIKDLSAELASENVKGLYQQEMVVLDYADLYKRKSALSTL